MVEAQLIQEYLVHLLKICKDAGNLIRAKKDSSYKVIRKSKYDMVTEIDMEAQEMIISYLTRNSNCKSIISEEILNSEIFLDDYFVIDPIDGTHNYIAGLPFYGVSIAYIAQNRVQLGTIYFPESNQMYHAQLGKGAFCNSEIISVSKTNTLNKSIIAYDNQFQNTKDSLNIFSLIQNSAFTTRILGSATRDACYIAEGILDARIWNSTKLCDIAAASLIVEEAGGRVTDFEGNAINLDNVKDVIMSNGSINHEIINCIRKIDTLGKLASLEKRVRNTIHINTKGEL